MAIIRAAGDRSVLKIKEFLGLNENPDGDTRLQIGELSQLRNFRITPDRHLQIRPGQKTVLDLFPVYEKAGEKFVPWPKLSGVFYGMIQGREHLVVDYGSNLWDVDITGAKEPRNLGTCDLDRNQEPVCFFGFNNKLYLLDGRSYKSWDGGDNTQFQDVEGYIPTILTAAAPDGTGVQLEKRNRLTGKVKVQFSPDGKTTEYQLPDKKLTNFIRVEGTDAGPTFYPEIGQVWFTKPPAAGTNTLTITYETRENQRKEVTKMRFAEFYNGTTDARVFLYGDGSNRCIYSGVDLRKATATAEYFPDLSEAEIGAANSPITAMIRHYGRLLVFKSDSAWALDHTLTSLPGGGLTAAFSVTPVNRGLGNEAPGQVRLLENNPLSLSGGAIYQWKTGGTGIDYRSARRISDRVGATLGGWDLKQLRTFNCRSTGEYWFLNGSEALILCYRNDCWYRYSNMDFFWLEEMGGSLYGFRKNGTIARISRDYRNDDGQPIEALAETGSMDFDRDFMKKYVPVLYVALQPETGARVGVSVETNRRSDYPEQAVSASSATLSRLDFRHLSFSTNRKPQVRRLKLKIKKATFCKLVYRSRSASATATVLETDLRLRYSGNVK